MSVTHGMPLRERLKFIPAPHNIYAASMMHVLVTPGYEHEKQHCMILARQAIQRVAGNAFDKFFYKGTAHNTGVLLAESPYNVPIREGPQEGDLVFQLDVAHGMGHVGIVIPRRFIGEDWSGHWNGEDARGIRSLDDWGEIDVIARFPQTIPRAGK